MESDREYWMRRADEERAIADGCTQSNAAAIHRRLAIYYATKAMGDPPTSAITALPLADQA